MSVIDNSAAAPPPAELLQQALALIRPADVEACRFAIWGAYYTIEGALWRERFLSLGSAKPKMAALVAALQRVDAAFRQVDDPEFSISGFPIAELRHWRSVFEQAQRNTSPRTRLAAKSKQLAIAAAYNLLATFGRRRRIQAGSGSNFCRLSACLYGRPADLRNQCRRYLTQQRHENRASLEPDSRTV